MGGDGVWELVAPNSAWCCAVLFWLKRNLVDLSQENPLKKGSQQIDWKRIFIWQKEWGAGSLKKNCRGPRRALKKALRRVHWPLPCKVSGCTIQMLAEDAILDGAQHEELHQIAKAGSHGVHPGSIHRDQMVSFCTGLDIPDPIDIWVPCKNPKSLKKDVEAASCFLPHQMFAKLANYDAKNLSTWKIGSFLEHSPWKRGG